jgi:hypothetical protein
MWERALVESLMAGTSRGLRNFDSCLRAFHTILLPAESIFRNLQNSGLSQTFRSFGGIRVRFVRTRERQEVVWYEVRAPTKLT